MRLALIFFASFYESCLMIKRLVKKSTISIAGARSSHAGYRSAARADFLIARRVDACMRPFQITLQREYEKGHVLLLESRKTSLVELSLRRTGV